MPSSRRTRARASAPVPGVPEPTRQCQALLADEETRCSLRFQGRRGSYCPPHGREYGELTGAYKDVSNRVDALEPEMRKARMGAVVLCTVADVDAAIALANRYLGAVGDEIGGRETHHKRFFREADENHGKWLKHRRGEQQAAMCLLERLQRRREEVVAVEAAARRSAEWRKAIEESYAAAEAQRKATEQARRKAAQNAGISTIEDQRRAVAQLQRSASATRSVLGERTNAVVPGRTSTQRSAAPNSNQVEVPGTRRVPPGYWPPIDPPRPAPPPRYPQPQPQPRPQPPQRIEQHPSAARETQPLLRPAGVPRGTVFIPPANSWVCDVESQSNNTGRLRARVFQPAPHVRNEESIDCGCSKMLFCAVSLFVFCHLVVLAYIWNGHH